MSKLAKQRATYEDLSHIPENMTGEIIEGELIVTPRPSRKHVYTTSALGSEVGAALSVRAWRRPRGVDHSL
jgi:hypothetical protein